LFEKVIGGGWKSGCAEFLARKKFVLRRQNRGRWTKRQSEPFCGKCCDVGRPIAYCCDSVEGSAGDDRFDALVGRVESQRDCIISPGIVENVASIGGEHKFESELVSHLGKSARLITGGSGYEENAHACILWEGDSQPASPSRTI
jgi:hypothetical protein